MVHGDIAQAFLLRIVPCAHEVLLQEPEENGGLLGALECGLTVCEASLRSILDFALLV